MGHQNADPGSQVAELHSVLIHNKTDFAPQCCDYHHTMWENLTIKTKRQSKKWSILKNRAKLCSYIALKDKENKNEDGKIVGEKESKRRGNREEDSAENEVKERREKRGATEKGGVR